MFDQKEFLKEKFEPRTEEIKVPALSAWFPEGEDPVIKLRGVTSAELAQANEAFEKNRLKISFANAIAGDDAEKMKSIREALGLSSEQTPAELAKRIVMVKFASGFSEDVCVKLAEKFPVEFLQISNKVTELTGLGAVAVKRKPSGKTQK